MASYLFINKRVTTCATEVPVLEKTMLMYDKDFKPDRNVELNDVMRRACTLLAPINHHIYCWMQSRLDPHAGSKWLELTSIPKDDVEEDVGGDEASSASNVPRFLNKVWEKRGYLNLKTRSSSEYVDKLMDPNSSSYGMNIGSTVELAYPQYSYALLKRVTDALEEIGVVQVEGIVPVEDLRKIRRRLRIQPLRRTPYEKMRAIWRQQLQETTPTGVMMSMDPCDEGQDIEAEREDWYEEQGLVRPTTAAGSTLSQTTTGAVITAQKFAEKNNTKALPHSGFRPEGTGLNMEPRNGSATPDQNKARLALTSQGQRNKELSQLSLMGDQESAQRLVVQQASSYEARVASAKSEETKQKNKQIRGAHYDGIEFPIRITDEEDLLSEWECRSYDHYYLTHWHLEKIRMRQHREKELLLKAKRQGFCDVEDRKLMSTEAELEAETEEFMRAYTARMETGDEGGDVEFSSTKMQDHRDQQKKALEEEEANAGKLIKPTGTTGKSISDKNLSAMQDTPTIAEKLKQRETFNDLRDQWNSITDPRAENAVTCMTPVIGRRHLLLRDTIFEEDIKPLLTYLTPMVNAFFEKQVAKQQIPDNSVPYVSEMQLVTSDPLASELFWHKDNTAVGLTAVIPLTMCPGNLSPMRFLGYSHKSWKFGSSIRGGPLSVSLRPEDVLFYDCRVLKNCSPNASYSRTLLYLIVRYDVKAPPGQSSVDTQLIVWMGKLLNTLHRVQSVEHNPILSGVSRFGRYVWDTWV